jgi:hypothetical protein
MWARVSEYLPAPGDSDSGTKQTCPTNRMPASILTAACGRASYCWLFLYKDFRLADAGSASSWNGVGRGGVTSDYLGSSKPFGPICGPGHKGRRR